MTNGTSDTPNTPDETRHAPGSAAPGTTVETREIGAAPLPGPDAPRPAADHPAIESSLLGEGGLPAARRKAGRIEDAEFVAPRAPLSQERDAAAEPAPPAEQPGEHRAASLAADRSAAAEQVPLAPPRPAERVIEVRRGGFVPTMLGGIVAAGLGAGALWYGLPHLPPAWRPPMQGGADQSAGLTAAADAGRRAAAEHAAGIEQRSVAAAEQAARAAAEAALKAAPASTAAPDMAPVRQGLQQLGERLTALEQRPAADTAPQLQALSDRLAAIEQRAPGEPGVPAQLQDLAQRLAALEGRAPADTAPLASQIEDLSRRVAAIEGRAPTDVAPLSQQLQALTERLAAVEQRPAVDPAEAKRLADLAAGADAARQRVETAARDAEQRLAQAQQQAEALQQAADAAARRATAAAAAASLGTALQTGAPREAALAQLQQSDVAVPQALSQPVRTPEELAAAFDPAARAALRAALQARSAAGRGSVVGNFLRAQTGARSVAPREGSDADAVLSRAGDAARRGDIAGALDQLKALPEEARPAMAAWTADAEAYVAAQTAVAGLVGSAAPADAQAPARTTGEAAVPSQATPGDASAPTPTPVPAAAN